MSYKKHPLDNIINDIPGLNSNLSMSQNIVGPGTLPSPSLLSHYNIAIENRFTPLADEL